jgi:hypothetical protein
MNRPQGSVLSGLFRLVVSGFFPTLLLLGCDSKSANRVTALEALSSQDSGNLAISVRFHGLRGSKPASTESIDRVSAHVFTDTVQVAQQDLTIQGTTFSGTVEVLPQDDLSVAITFWGGGALRWYGGEGVTAVAGRTTPVTVLAAPLRAELSGPASIQSDSSFVLSWADFIYPANFEVQQSQLSDFSNPTQIYLGTDTVLVRSAKTGSVYFRLRVQHAMGTGPWSDPLVVTSENRSPNAEAGPDQSVGAGSTVQLNGLLSSDPDGEDLSFYWSSLSGVALENSSIAQPQFEALAEGTYLFALIVSDGNVLSQPDTVAITVIQLNRTPVANAGPNRVVAVGESVALDGSGSSDADGDELMFRWSAPADVVLSDSTSAQATVKPSTVGEYRVSLVVSDGTENSEADEVVVKVVQPNASPVANAGTDRAGQEGGAVEFDGSGSTDSDGTIGNYLWSFGDGSTSTEVSVSHVFVDDGNYSVTLTVTDDSDSQGSDTLQVVVENLAPVAQANGPYSGVIGGPIQFTGGVVDPGSNDTHTFEWQFGDGDMTAGSVTTHTYAVPGVYALILTATDNGGAVGSDSTNVTVSESPPTTGDAEVVGEIEEDTGDAEIIGEIEENTGDAEVVGEIEESTGDAEIAGEVQG